MGTLIGTPYNAIVFGSGDVNIPQMARAGAPLFPSMCVATGSVAIVQTGLSLKCNENVLSYPFLDISNKNNIVIIRYVSSFKFNNMIEVHLPQAKSR